MIQIEHNWKNNQLYGDLISTKVNDAIESIKKIITTLDTSHTNADENEKILYIYDDENSPLYKALTADAEISKHLIIRHGNQA
jgi:hypothetical protein